MRLALRFWGFLAVWAGILLTLLLSVTLASGQGAREVLANLMSWTGLALALAAYPAGVAVSAGTFAERRPVPRQLVAVMLAAASVSLIAFSLGNYVAPFAQRWLTPETEVRGSLEPATMTLGELKRQARAAVERAEAAAPTESARFWQAANRLAWHYVRRTDGAALPFLLGLIGLLTGYWSRWSRRRELQQAQQWGMGLFLVLSTYLVGENSYELIAMRSAGPVFFAGDLVMVVPLLLVVGLGWPTAVTLWRRQMDSEVY